MAIKFNNVSYLDKLKNITYSFEKNKITSIIGCSGSGKTLLSYLMTGLVLPNEGTILVGETTINNKTKKLKQIRKNIGYVFQNPEEQFFASSVKEEIEFSFKNYKYSLDNSEEKIIELLNKVGLDKTFLTRNPFDLSGGEKEKLALAIALSLDPEILILDEPTIYLDDKSTSGLIELLKKLKDKTVIIISNDINFINKVTDNIVMLKNGKINLKIPKDKFIDNIDKIKKSGMEIPKILEFISMIEKYKKKKIDFTEDINKLVCEIRKNV